MTAEQFEKYYPSTLCLCGNEKSELSAMCHGCRAWMEGEQPAILHIINNGTGETLLQGIGEFESIVRQAKG